MREMIIVSMKLCIIIFGLFIRTNCDRRTLKILRCQEYVPLGEKIKDKLYNPTKYDIDDGVQLISDLHVYNSRLNGIYLMIKHENSKGTRVFNYLTEIGGPAFVTRDLNFTFIRRVYNYTDDNVIAVTSSIRITKDIWKRAGKLPPAKSSESIW